MVERTVTAEGIANVPTRASLVRTTVVVGGVVVIGTVLAVRLARKAPGSSDEDRWLAAWLVVGLVDVVAGAALVRRLGHRRLAACLILVGAASFAVVAAATTSAVPTPNRLTVLSERNSWARALATGTLIALLPWELAPTDRRRTFEIVWWTSAALVTLVTLGYATGVPAARLDPVDVGVAALSISATAAVARLVVRWWRLRATARDPLYGWIVAGALVAWLAIVPGWLDVIPTFPHDGLIGPALLIATLPLLVVGVVASDLRERRGRFHGVAHEVIAWVVLSGGILLLYTGVVAGLGRFVGGTGRTWLLVITTCVVAISVEPVRRRIQATVDHLVWGSRGEPLDVVRDVIGHVGADTVDALLPSITSSLQRELRLDSVAIDVRTDSGWRRAATAGTGPTSHRRIVELEQHGRSIGRLEVGWEDGPHLRRRDEQVLRELEGPLTVAVGWVQLVTELREASAAVVSAREAERRRVRRDLHDGLGPALTGVSFMVRTALRKLDRVEPDDTGRAAELLGRAADDIDLLVVEVKRIARDLRPTALVRHGLVDAVEEFSRRFASLLEFHLDLPHASGELPENTEKAAYMIVTEAVTNVIRHADATRCAIRITVDDVLVTIEVSDDGSGVGDPAPGGSGLVGMRERALELGGSILVESHAGAGTTVTARLPVVTAGAA
jgi:two-component system NarL family sensor kinase